MAHVVNVHVLLRQPLESPAVALPVVILDQSRDKLEAMPIEPAVTLYAAQLPIFYFRHTTRYKQISPESGCHSSLLGIQTGNGRTDRSVTRQER